ncbi:MAG: hypothetical protein ACREMF_11360 [Gemmatimonadales bacterium]
MVTPLALLVLVAGAQGSDRLGSAAPRIALGFGVDTSQSPVREIFATWRAFLEDRPDSLHPSPHWSRAEQAKYGDYLLGREYLFQGFPQQFPAVTVLTIAPAVPGAESVYVLKTLVGGVYQPGDEVKLLGIFRVYAVRERARWVLSNAIDRVTATWKRNTVGSVTFVYPPWHHLDGVRARRSARFADSLAKAFTLRPVPLTYYVAETPENMFRLQGLDFVPEPGGAGAGGGRADDVNGLVFSGSPVIPEGYLHEIAHVVLAPLKRPGRTHRLAVEGIATWTGGSRGQAFPALMREFAFFLKNRWGFTLDSALTQPPPVRFNSLDATGAVLFQLAYERGGLAAVRSLFDTGTTPDEVRNGIAKVLGVAPNALDAVWRRKVLRYAR